MKHQEVDKKKKQQRRNMMYSEDRMGLLDTIRDMISDEFERRGVTTEHDNHPENPPPEPPPRRRSFWQRIVSLFTACL